MPKQVKKPRPNQPPARLKPPTIAELAGDTPKSSLDAFRQTGNYLLIFFRSFVASILAVTAINLLVIGIVIGWGQNTFLDTAKFSAIVAPIIDQPATQKFLTKQTTDLVINGIDDDQLADLLLSEQNKQLSPEAQKKILRFRIEDSINQVVSSGSFSKLWKSETTRVHQELINELSGNSSDGVIDLSKLVKGILAQLQTTELQPVVKALNVPADAGRVKLSPGTLDNIQRGYDYSFSSTALILTFSLVFAVLTIVLSLNRLMALRHMVVVLAISTASLAILLSFPVRVGLGSENSRATQEAFQEITKLMLSDLKDIYVKVAIASGSVAVAIFIWQGLEHHRNTKLRGVPKRARRKSVKPKS